MPIAQALLPELEYEMKVTREVLERVPEEQAAWKPHPKSYSLGDLATHVSNIVFWGVVTVREPEFDLAGSAPRKYEGMKTVLENFDRNAAEYRALVEKASDEHLRAHWTLRNGARTVMSTSRVGVLRTFVMNHLIHHRAQLTVYLRLRDVPLPRIYGPTADEK
jgi:uncharacterized damage-inducible protein DinB